MPTHDPTPLPTNPNSEPAQVRDRRVSPTGVLPRRMQTWIMVGAAIVVVLIILLTGHADPTRPPVAGTRPSDASLARPDQIKTFEQQLREAEARARAAAAGPGAPAAAVSSSATGAMAGRAPSATSSLDQPVAEAKSLFADSVVSSRRPAGDQPFAASSQTPAFSPLSTPATALQDQIARLERQLVANPAGGAVTSAGGSTGSGAGIDSVPTRPTSVQPENRIESPPAASSPPAAPPRPYDTASTRSPRASMPPASPREPAASPTTVGATQTSRHRLLEGTIIEAVLLTRLNGTFAGPVNALVTTPVYSFDRQSLLIPQGARILGSSAAVQSFGDSRLAVSFHRLLMPDGHSYSLDAFKGLSTAGETGLTEAVNHHYLQVFGASIAVGGLAGLAQFTSRANLTTLTSSETFAQASGASLANSATRILDRYLNVLPTITIREGYRLKVYLTSDYELPEYVAVPGGVIR